MQANSITLLITLLFFIFLYLKRESYVTNLALTFNFYAFLYFFVGISIAEFFGWGYTTLLFYLATIAVLGFNSGYLILRNRITERSPIQIDSSFITYTTLKLLVFIGILAEIYVILSVGTENFFFIDRYERFPILKAYQPVLYIATVINIAFPLLLIRWLVLGDEKSKRLFWFVVLHNTIMTIMTVSRSAILLNFISVAFILERQQILTKKKIIIGGLTILSGMFFIRGILYLLILKDGTQLYFNPGELINWVKNTEILLDNNVTHKDFPTNSYLLTLKALVIPSPKEDAPAEWFIKTFFEARAVAGFTRGFSGLIEGYLYLKALGVFIHFFIIGMLFGYVENSRRYIFLIISMFFAYAGFRLFRSEVYNFAKYVQWYYIIPLVLIYYSNKVFLLAYERK